MYLAWSGLALYGFMGGWGGRVALLVVLLVTATIAGRSLRFGSYRDVIPYSLGWVILIALFDALYAVPSAGWAIYQDPNLWVGYALVLFIPLFAPSLKRPLSHREPVIS